VKKEEGKVLEVCIKRREGEIGREFDMFHRLGLRERGGKSREQLEDKCSEIFVSFDGIFCEGKWEKW
jgi:hypothetical protein